MSIPKGNPQVKIVTGDNIAFSLKGMCKPSFYNDGNTNVEVFEATIPPGGQLEMNYDFEIHDKSVSIKFKDTETQVTPKKKKLNVYFGTLIKEPC